MKKRTLFGPGLLCVFAASLPQMALAADFVRVKTGTANIRVSAAANSGVVAKATRGQVFRANAYLNGWFEVYMFGGEYRYLNSSTVESVPSPPPLTDSEATLRKACKEMVAAQDRANAEAERRYPDPDYKRQIDLQRALYDRYELPVFLKYDIAPAHGAHLTTTCAKNRWF